MTIQLENPEIPEITLISYVQHLPAAQYQCRSPKGIIIANFSETIRSCKCFLHRHQVLTFRVLATMKDSTPGARWREMPDFVCTLTSRELSQLFIGEKIVNTSDVVRQSFSRI